MTPEDSEASSVASVFEHIDRSSIYYVLSGGALLLSLLTVLFEAHDPVKTSPDIGWYLYAAEKLLEGAEYGRGIIDNNPPLAYWMHATFLWISRLLDLSPSVGLHVIVLVIILGVGRAIFGLVRRDTGDRRFALTAATLVCTFLLLNKILLFAMREHLISVLVTPYIVYTAVAIGGRVDISGRASHVVAGMAAVGIALKPHYALLWIVFEAWRWFETRQFPWRRTENGLVVSIGIAYLAAVWLMAPEYIRLLPIIVEGYSDTYILWSYWNDATISACAVIAAAVIVPFPERASHYCRAYLLATISFAGVAFLQGKGFAYHFNPAITSASTFGGLLWCAFALEFDDSALPFGLPGRVFLLSTLAGLFIYSGTQVQRERNEFDRRAALAQNIVMPKLFDKYAAGDSVFVMSAEVVATFPAAHLADVDVASRFSSLWFVPGSYTPRESARTPFPYHEPESMPASERIFIEMVIEDLARDKPALIVEDNTYSLSHLKGSDFDFLEYFKRMESFRDVFEHYEFIRSVGPFDFYLRQSNE